MQPDGGGDSVRAARTAGFPERFGGCYLEAHQVVDHAIQLSFVEHVRSAHLYQSDEIVGEAGCYRSPSPRLGDEVRSKRKTKKRFRVQICSDGRNPAAEHERRAPANDVGWVCDHVCDPFATLVSQDVSHKDS
ncbi:hypothetical protein KUV28_15085 [Ferrimonas balearica]|nr:hypothetical protein [Ferrimonas balearica]